MGINYKLQAFNVALIKCCQAIFSVPFPFNVEFICHELAVEIYGAHQSKYRPIPMVGKDVIQTGMAKTLLLSHTREVITTT